MTERIKTEKMKILIAFILTPFTLAVFSQQTDSPERPTNSFEKEYSTSNPTF
ncbi:MAG: hypothetical protein KBA86_09080 [Bacteroidales bacterium]|nr:hypothetical protein [Bacteroidales bacterium]